MPTFSKVEKKLLQDVLEAAARNIHSQIDSTKLLSENIFELSRISFIYQIFSRLVDFDLFEIESIPDVLYEDLVSFLVGSKGSIDLNFDLESFSPSFTNLVRRLKSKDPIEQVFNLSLLYGAALDFNMVKGENGKELTLSASNAKRKQSGSYFTPPGLVRKLVDEVVAELVPGDSICSEKKGLKIVDPACGPGIFLAAAYEKVSCKTNLDQLTLSNMIYGVDSDCAAVFLARLNLWNLVGLRHPQVFKDKIRLGNSLIGSNENGDKGKVNPDEHCALWFGEDSFNDPEKLKKRYRFFHWTNEFKEVFESKQGFDAVIGNPPWEIAKPNSREFFSQYDVEYYTYPKQKALVVQKQILELNEQARERWYQHNQEKKLTSNWVKNAPLQFSPQLHGFQYQGKGDFNLYKSFLEQAYYLTCDRGIVSFLVPAGLYCDRGASELRKLLLEKCHWISLTSFENTDGVFNIHRSFKYCYFVARKTDNAAAIKASFLTNLKEDQSSQDGAGIKYNSQLVKRFSPISNIILEVENSNVLELLSKIYDSSNYLYETEYGGMRLKYTRELDMTIDSRLFVKRSQLESLGFIQDEYGNWLKGNWQASDERLTLAASSHDHTKIIRIADIEETYIPLYEGRMVGQYDFSKKKWISGSGRRAIWKDNEESLKKIEPQYLVSLKDFQSPRIVKGLKTGFLAVGSDTNSRTMISACLNDVVCGNAVPVFTFESTAGELDIAQKNSLQLVLTAIFNSFIFDFVLRRRMAGTNLNYFVIEECPLPRELDLHSAVLSKVVELVARLNFTGPRYSEPLSSLGLKGSFLQPEPLKIKLLKAALDTLVQHLYKLSFKDMLLILDGFNVDYKSKTNKKRFELDFDYDAVEPLERVSEKLIAQTNSGDDFSFLEFFRENDFDASGAILNPKGFYRVDKELPVAQRQTYLTLLLSKIMDTLGLEHYLKFLEKSIQLDVDESSSKKALVLQTQCLNDVLCF